MSHQNETAKTARPNSAILRFYNKFEHLAYQYAKQVFHYERYGYEAEDVVQEFKIKIYTSIISYGEKLAEYKLTGRYKPVPIEFYLKSAMVNKVKDFVRKFNLKEVANADKVSIQDNQFDYGTYTTMTSEFDIKENVYVLNGVDLLANLCRVDKVVFCLYLKGYPIRDLKRKFKNVTNPEQVVKKQIKYLRTYKEQLLDYQKQNFCVFSYEEEAI